MYDFVEVHNVQASNKQKHYFDEHTSLRNFKQGDPVWLSIPTAGKLDARWEGEWSVKSVMSPTTYTISDGNRSRTVHINRLRPRLQASNTSTLTAPPQQEVWSPPSIEHHVVEDDLSGPRYPTRARRPPDRYHP